MRGRKEFYGNYETQCHIVLEKTPVNYYVSVRDVPFIVKSSFGGSMSVDHSQYVSNIQSFGAQGWELAGLIDMPDMSLPGTFYSGLTSTSSTIKLIFQASAQPGDPGGIL